MTDVQTKPKGARTETLEAPGVRLRYDVREPDGDARAPVLLMIGSPMSAAGFTTLAEYFRDRTVVTYDPRGVGRSERTDEATESTPEDHADDLHRLISAVEIGPIDVFASSGGATNALALVARHPEDVRTLVAHEPPAVTALPDREEAAAAVRDIYETYQRDGLGPGMAKFIALVQFNEPIPADHTDRPAPDPAAFGLPTEDDGSRDDVLLGQNLIGGYALRARLRRAPRGADPHCPGGGRRVRGRARPPRRARRGRAARPGGSHLPQSPRGVPRRRVRPAGRPGRLRGDAARGAGRERLDPPRPRRFIVALAERWISALDRISINKEAIRAPNDRKARDQDEFQLDQHARRQRPHG